MDLPRIAFLLLAGALLLGGPARGGEEGTDLGATPPGVVLETGAEAGGVFRLRIERGKETVVDRGTLRSVLRTGAFQGSFRYWDEPGGRMLYLYDEVQNLAARVVNPRRVTVLPLSAP